MVFKNNDIQTSGIPPFEHNTHKLLLELLPYQLTVLLWNKIAKKPVALEQFSWSDDHENNWESIVRKSVLLVLTDVEVCIYSTSPNLLIVPNKFYKSSDENYKQIDLLFGTDYTFQSYTNELFNHPITLSFKQYDVIIEEIEEHFEKVKIKHLATGLIDNYQSKNIHEGILIVHPNTCLCVIFQNNKLLLCKSIAYTEPQDLLYHILNTCDTLRITNQDMYWRIGGMISKHAAIHECLNKYLTNLIYTEVNSNSFANTEPHFYEHLFQLAL